MRVRLNCGMVCTAHGTPISHQSTNLQSRKDVNPRTRTILVALLVILFVGVGFLLRGHFKEGHGHAHAHEESGATALSLNNGKRWDTDLPLRTGMQRIRDAASPVLAAHAKRSVSPNDAKALSASIQEHVNFLIQNCKLEPKADAALHILITDLLRGGALLAADPASPEGATLLTQALRQYPDYFDHPGWTPLPAGGV
jgi:flagellar basal body-associated protein FliL